MSHHIDQAPALLAELARPTSVYKRRAWLAMGGLAAFMAMYLLLAAWFLFTAYRLTFGADINGKHAFVGYIVGACAAFLAVFMLKAIFFVKRGGTDGSIEVTAEQQPKLFEFLHGLADKAGAPRPHKVFLSARVNAAVFYDLSIINLLLPSKKNLEIGLGLVNVLTLGELRAVLAHEFGHFAQRAMAVGRWVYVAQQIAGHLVARRDKLDDFLRALSGFDFRVAWVGWILSLIVWSIRSLVESAFNVVVLMQRALSREMEMQADLVAVSLTGSDALIHALHRLQAADDSWGRAMNFASGERGKGRLTADVFSVQTRVQEKMAQLLNDPGYTQVPPLPASAPEAHRLFKAELAQPPQMWLTHPLNHEREANAKRHYVAAAIDQGSAWRMFDDPAQLRREVSATLFEAGDAALVPEEDSLLALDKEFEREHLKPAYRGVYYGRSPVRAATHASELYVLGRADLEQLRSLYPESLRQDMEQLAQLEKEIGQLRALQSGAFKSEGNVIRLRGKELKKKQLPQAIKHVEREAKEIERRLQAHDQLCRSTHLAAAAKLGNGWVEYLQGLLALLHYADHTVANLRDAQGVLANTVNLATATRRVNSGGIDRILTAANALYHVLDQVHQMADQVAFDNILRQRLESGNWKEMLGEWTLPWASRENISDWLNVIDGWVNQAAGACGAVRLHALEQLLVSEAVIARHIDKGTQIVPAPAPSKAPVQYDVLLPGQERKRQEKLDWWARFQTADGIVPAIARLLAAGGIVAAVLGLGGSIGSASLAVYNGLGRPVLVKVAGKSLRLAPFSSANTELDADRTYRIETSTEQGRQIESFEADVKDSFANVVYNVAGAGPLVEWTSVYGNGQARPERDLGAPRWSTSSADVLFAEPPKSISSKTGGATREVLTGMGELAPAGQLGLVQNDAQKKALIHAHARWESTASPYIGDWLALASKQPEFTALIEARLAETPNDAWLLRVAYDGAPDAQKNALCARYNIVADTAPDNPDLRYAALRCLPDSASKMEAFDNGYKRWPKHAWFAYAHGYAEAEFAHWAQASEAFARARSLSPSIANWIAVQQIRVQRMQDNSLAASEALAKGANDAEMLLAPEAAEKRDIAGLDAYRALGRGNLDDALRLSHARPESEARLVRLVAASDGATPSQLARAFGLDKAEGIDEGTLWESVALAMRMRHDFTPFLGAAKDRPTAQQVTGQVIQEFLKRAGSDPGGAEKLLDGLSPELRGHAYSAAVVLLGRAAPQAWRESAKRLLFVPEHPYFI